MIEKLSRMNKDLKEEILKRKLKEGELEKERQRLEAALEQKELLLREVNHRVKNNLQVVKSLLSVQVDLSESGEVADALDAFSGRLDSLVSLHTLLYQSDATGDISLLKFVEEIFNGVFDDRVDLRLECVDYYVYFEKLSTLGMILHEIATNSCKHAWKENDKNRMVDVEIKLINDVLFVKYRDNGSKLKKLDDIKPGFGVELLNILLSSTIQNKKDLHPEGGLMYEFSLNMK